MNNNSITINGLSDKKYQYLKTVENLDEYMSELIEKDMNGFITKEEVIRLIKRELTNINITLSLNDNNVSDYENAYTGKKASSRIKLNNLNTDKNKREESYTGIEIIENNDFITQPTTEQCGATYIRDIYKSDASYTGKERL